MCILAARAAADYDPPVRNEFPQPFGPYELLRRLGRGGMAEVFLAKASSARGENRLVALKRMHQQLSEDQSAVEMLIQEARLCMQFNHDNIAQTFELGCHDGTYFFIMEYVDGVDLGTVANVVEARGGRLEPAVVAWVCAGMARGLAYSHDLCDDQGKRLGIVHRDVSPQNVLIGRNGQVKLIDFGVAKVASRIQQTMAGIIKGKYAYMSPEQASAETVDARSDVFSLGICMHELFSGRALFRGIGGSSPFAILRAVRDEPIAMVHNLAPGLPAELSRITHKALERDLSRRYPTMAALADDLEAWLKRGATRFDGPALAEYVRKVVSEAPSGSVPQNAIATPAIAKMSGDEFEPSQMSVVAASPLEARKLLRRVPGDGTPAAGRVPSINFPRAHLTPGMRAELDAPPRPPPPAQVVVHMAQPSPPQAPALSQGMQEPPVTGLRPNRRVVMQFLWVGVVALIFALGWSTIATLLRIGKL